MAITYRKIFDAKLSRESARIQTVFRRLPPEKQDSVRQQFYRHLRICIKTETPTDVNWLNEVVMDARRDIVWEMKTGTQALVG